MCATGKLFRVDITGDKVWEIYLNAFEQDPVFRDPNSSQCIIVIFVTTF